MLALVLVAVSLGLSNFAASVGVGLAGTSARLRWRVAAVFGVFEAGMPVVGILLGRPAAAAVGSSGRYVAGLVLALAGGYALAQAARAGAGPGTGVVAPTRHGAGLVLTALALSVDNLVVGFALGAFDVGLVAAAVVIGVVSVALSLAGLEIGRFVGSAAGARADVAAGLVLVAVGAAVAAGLL